MSKSKSASGTAGVLVVDDSIFMRRMISDMVDRFPGFRVVGASADGREALLDIERLEPDIVTLDIEMPRLDGFEVLRRVMETSPIPIVVLSAYTSMGSEAALRALDLGAVDFVPKPSGPISFDLAKVEARLFEALQAAAEADMAALLRERERGGVAAAGARPRSDTAVAIAASTGGPRALSNILAALPGDLGAAVLIVQHMPPGFTSTLAARLNQAGRLAVAEATGGEAVTPNRVWVAPGDFHMRVRRTESSVRIALDQREPLWGTRPAADALFPSIAEVFPGRSVGVVLTGMGRDGAAGLAAILAAGGRTLAQDRATSIVYGMPGRAAALGVAERIVPLEGMAAAIVDAVATLADAQPAETE